ncbi:MAG: CPBP family glutamic-type intramembrane protease [Desulfuromonadaceae bacterium]|nr:CPBP family glutamic-type intramembrane protease [Desulfuromonadaceae bacterium]
MSGSGTFRSNPIRYATALIGSLKTLGNSYIFGFAVILQLFFFLASPYIWGPELASSFLTYMVMLALAFALLGVENPLRFIKTTDGIVQYLVAFVGGLFLLTFLGLGASNNLDYGVFGSLSGLILAQSICVGMSEELLFRGAIPRALEVSGLSYKLSRLIAIICFAGFHVFAYNWSISSLIASFVFGLLMQFIWDAGRIMPGTTKARMGYPLVSIGLHAAWNVVVLAPFTVLVI